MRHRIRLPILALVLLIALPLAAGATEALPSSGDGYQYWLSGPQTSIFIPADYRVALVDESVSETLLYISNPALPDSTLAFFAVALETAGLYLTDEDIHLFASRPPDGSTSYTVEPVHDEAYGILAISTTNAMDDAYVNTYAAQYNDSWLFSAAVYCHDGRKAPTDAEREWQVNFIRSALSSPEMQRVQSLTLPGSNISLTMPEGYTIGDVEQTGISVRFNVYADATGYLAPDVMCACQYIPELRGEAIATADAATLERLIALMPGQDAGAIAYTPVSLDGYTALSYQQDGARHLLAIHGTWGLHFTQRNQTRYSDLADAHRMQDAIMRIALGGQDTRLLPYMPQRLMRKGRSLYIPLQGSVLGLDLPQGYRAGDAVLTDTSTSFAMSCIGDIRPPMQLLVYDTAAFSPEILAQQADESQFLYALASANSDHALQLVEKGFLGGPMLTGKSKRDGYDGYWMLADHYLIELRYMPSNIPELVLPLLNFRLL